LIYWLKNLRTIKKDLIINDKTTELSELTNKENAVVGKIQKLDKIRITLMNDITNVLGQNARLTLTELSELMKNQPEYERLYGLTLRTQETLDELKALNDQNRMLIENSLEYINFTVNVIRGQALPEQAIYDSSGEEIGLRQGFFDAKQ